MPIGWSKNCCCILLSAYRKHMLQPNRRDGIRSDDHGNRRPGVGADTALTSSPINTLFTTPSRRRTEPGSFMVSVLLHGVAFAIGAFAILHTPRVDDTSPVRRYTTRMVKLQGVEPRLQWSPAGGAAQTAPHVQMHAVRSGDRQVAAATPQSLAYRVSAPITLVQPDIQQNTLLPLKTPIPLMVMWTPPNIRVAKIVPPPPPTKVTASMRPSLSLPNHEANLANVELSSTSYVSETIPVPASTTFPIVLPGPQSPQVPETASSSSVQPAAATVISVSDLLLTKGTVALPYANQTAAASNSNSFTPGRSVSSSATGNGTAVSKQNQGASGAGSGGQGNQEASTTGPASENGTGAGSNSGSDSGLSPENGLTIQRITRPKDGHFGFVVVGDSVTDQYPEAAGIWADRLAYTVYLHVGAVQSWILQYCLPRAVQAAGNNYRPDAPWPYLIVTPHLAPGDSDTNALLVHGFIDTAGHFEKLAIVFPTQFAQSKFVLSALQQWQFRPAEQNGQSTAVEVLLIIPEEME